MDVAFDALKALPLSDRNAILALLGRWLDTPKPQRACLALVMWPELGDDGVAELAGVSARQLGRYGGYRRIKPTLADFKLSRPRSDNTKRRRGFSNPADPTA